MSQKLKSLEKILTSIDNDIELSFKNKLRILVKDKLNLDNLYIIRTKYLNIHNIFDGVEIFTSYNNKSINYFIRINIYKEENSKLKKLINNYLWNSINKEVTLFTIFNVYNGRKFIESFLKYVDKIKKNETVTYSKSKQHEQVNKILQNNQEKFGKNDFSIEIKIVDYFNDKVEYYQRIIENKDIIVKNIIIFNGIIKFNIQNISIELKNENIKPNIFSFKDISGFGVLSNGNGIEYKFKKGKNTYYLVKESIKRGYGEIIDFIDLIEILDGNKDQDKHKMVYNAVNYANTKIEDTFKIKDFFLVEEKAYKRQYKVNDK